MKIDGKLRSELRKHFVFTERKLSKMNVVTSISSVRLHHQWYPHQSTLKMDILTQFPWQSINLHRTTMCTASRVPLDGIWMRRKSVCGDRTRNMFQSYLFPQSVLQTNFKASAKPANWIEICISNIFRIILYKFDSIFLPFNFEYTDLSGWKKHFSCFVMWNEKLPKTLRIWSLSKM